MDFHTGHDDCVWERRTEPDHITVWCADHNVRLFIARCPNCGLPQTDCYCSVKP